MWTKSKIFVFSLKMSTFPRLFEFCRVSPLHAVCWLFSEFERRRLQLAGRSRGGRGGEGHRWDDIYILTATCWKLIGDLWVLSLKTEAAIRSRGGRGAGWWGEEIIFFRGKWNIYFSANNWQMCGQVPASLEASGLVKLINSWQLIHPIFSNLNQRSKFKNRLHTVFFWRWGS